MKARGADPMVTSITTVRISKKLRDFLHNAKRKNDGTKKYESYDEVIKRLINI